jgi:RNA polymerase sigma-70 factor, ECF subfamily
LISARRAARVDDDGELVLLADQDRSLWSRPMIEEGHAIVRALLRRDQPGPYQIQAAIQAVHDDAATATDTDWSQIVALYDQLLVFTPTPVVALNRAAALSERDGADAGLAELSSLADALDKYHPFHVAHGELLFRLGRADEAKTAYARALELVGNDQERRFLEHRLAGL